MTDRRKENWLVAVFLEWLKRHESLGSKVIVVREFPWFGRRVDIAMLAESGRTTAYELKMRNNGRAIQQAAYNRLAFDRSYVVTASEPSPESCRHAEEAGVGLIVVREDKPTVIMESPSRGAIGPLRRRLAATLRSRASR